MRIALSDGSIAIVDPEDYERLARHSWVKRSSYGYAARLTWINKKQGCIFMHHEILRTKQMVDHINGNVLDNRKCNLRITTKQRNAANCKVHKHNTSGYKGVSYMASIKKWRAYIVFNDKQVHLGCFIEKENAARTYDKKALELFGPHAKTNASMGLLRDV